MQPGPELNPLAALLGSLVIILIVSFLLYLYFAITLMIIARKSNTPNAWLAWIPIANLFLMCRAGRRSGAWALLLFIPLVNIFAMAMIWMSIAEARGKPPWTGTLIIVPFGGLIIPAYLALGPATQPDIAAAPRWCPNCRAPAGPAETFCRNCRAPLPAPPVTARMPMGKMVPVAMAAVLGTAVLTGGFAWYMFIREIPYTPPAREQPELPERAQGTLTEFPVDTDPDSPARPSSVVTQEFERASTRSAPAKVQVPREWLPAGVDRESLPRRASAITSAAYSPQRPRVASGSDSPPSANSGPDTYVHVMSTSGNRKAGEEIAGEISRASHGSRTGVRVDSPSGSTYTGARIQTPRTTIYVLNKQGGDIVIIIYAPEPEGQAIAERLAANVGNGGGLNDYPEVKDSLWSLPADPPDDLILVEVNSLTRAEMERPLLEAESSGSGESYAEVQRMLAQVRRFIPERLTAARYVDGSRRDWGVIQCDFGSTRRASNNWFFLRWTVGLSGMESVRVSDVDGLYANQGDERLLMFQKGPYLMFLVGPSAAPLERLAGLANRFQI
ncbi:MAG: DUF5684 domain-containing protein [Blastocatellia bacterium]|nr:DUF5684 domain-containing protein [Blastocatellia bacterium]